MKGGMEAKATVVTAVTADSLEDKVNLLAKLVIYGGPGEE